MKRFLAPLGILAILLAIGPAWAARTDLMTSSGKVASVDTAAHTLVVNVDGKDGQPHPMTFSILPDSKIVKASDEIQLSQVASGDRVTVTYRQDAGKNLVVNIGVQTES